MYPSYYEVLKMVLQRQWCVEKIKAVFLEIKVTVDVLFFLLPYFGLASQSCSHLPVFFYNLINILMSQWLS